MVTSRLQELANYSKLLAKKYTWMSIFSTIVIYMKNPLKIRTDAFHANRFLGNKGGTFHSTDLVWIALLAPESIEH